MKNVDVVVVGGGPGGAVAALYLARFNRSVIAFDDGRSRANHIGATHNYPTYVEGIEGPKILSLLHEQATKHGAVFEYSRVSSIEPKGDAFVVTAANKTYKARAIILATGMVDVLPTIQGIERAMEEGLVATCPVCHAYESNGRAIAILTNGERGVKEAEFLKRHAKSVTLLDMSPDGLQGIPAELTSLRVTASDITFDGGVACRSAEGTLHFDQLYCALGRKPVSDLPHQLGITTNKEGCILVDEFQETSVKNIFAVGDIVKGLDQMIVAEAEAAIATSHLNLRL